MAEACLAAKLGILLEYRACFGGDLSASWAWLGVEALFSGVGQRVKFSGQRLEVVHFLLVLGNIRRLVNGRATEIAISMQD